MPFLKGTSELEPSYPQVQKSAIQDCPAIYKWEGAVLLSRELFLIGDNTHAASGKANGNLPI